MVCFGFVVSGHFHGPAVKIKYTIGKVKWSIPFRPLVPRDLLLLKKSASHARLIVRTRAFNTILSAKYYRETPEFPTYVAPKIQCGTYAPRIRERLDIISLVLFRFFSLSFGPCTLDGSYIRSVLGFPSTRISGRNGANFLFSPTQTRSPSATWSLQVGEALNFFYLPWTSDHESNFWLKTGSIFTLARLGWWRKDLLRGRGKHGKETTVIYKMGWVRLASYILTRSVHMGFRTCDLWRLPT